MVEKKDILREILLKMNYDSSKTHNENIVEQDTRFTRYLDKVDSDPKSAAKFHKDISNFFQENRHGVLQVAAFGALAFGPVGKFLSLGLELADASLYYKEGDKYMTGLTLAFSLIPGLQLIPGFKNITKQSLVKILKFMELGPKSKIVLSQTEKETAEQIAKNSKWIIYISVLNLVKKSFSLLLKKLSLTNFIKFMMKWKSNNKIKYAIGHGLIQIGGIMYTYDKLAEMLGISPSGKDVPPKVSLKKRQQLEKLFQTEKPKIEKQVVENIEKNLTDEASLMELQKLMNESLSQDTMSSL